MGKIFVMGGGGFAMEPENLALDRFILSLAPSPHPRISFLPTASGDSEGYVGKFMAAYSTLTCEPSYLSLFKPHTRDLRSYLLAQDIIHVGGGNTRNLLLLWKEWGIDRILREALEQGVVLTGMSAGMLCWFEQGVTDSFGGSLEPIGCLGFLPGSACPHFDGEAERRPSYLRMIRDGKILGGIALDDGAGALYIDGRLERCVTSRAGAAGYLYETGSARERKLEVSLLARSLIGG